MNRDRPSVLVVDEKFAITRDSGKSIRTAKLLAACASYFNITYVAYVSSREEAVAARSVWNKLGVETIPVMQPRVGKRGLGQILTAARTLGRYLPASVAAWRTERFDEAVRETLQSSPYDLIHCEITQMAWAVPFDTGLPTVLNAHNVESVIWERLADVHRGPLKLVFRDQAKKIDRFEAAVLPRFNRVICVSEVDRGRMSDRFGVSNVRVIPNGADLEADPLPANPGAAGLLYPGALDWRPAQDGAIFLIKEVFPKIKRGCPEARVLIVGKSPPRWLRRLCAGTPGAECHENVPSMRPFYRRAKLVVVPLRVGSGSRLKILEALSYGRAVVSTTIGAEGLLLTDQKHLVIGDSAEVFASAVCDLMNNDARCSDLARDGRAAIAKNYKWENIGAEMVAAWSSLTHSPENS